MRLGILCLGVLSMVATAHAQRNRNEGTEATKRACSVEDCFFERDIREFEVIDQTHIIVYTGAQRCAFHIELRGTMCDLTYAPELYFTRRGDVPTSPIAAGAEPLSGRGPADPFDPLETTRRKQPTLRICSNDLTVQVTGGRFTESSTTNVATDRFGNPRTDCQVSTVTSITDDQLVEFYVGRGVVPPLPPMGAGEIEVGEQEEPEAGAAPADAPQADAPRTRGKARQ